MDADASHLVSARDDIRPNGILRDLHGRTFNNQIETYILPSDKPEWERLDQQHAALTIGFGGLYPCPELAESILAHLEGGEPKRILDAGCGTGIWAIEMAKRFPYAQVVGFDVAPVPVNSSCPANVSFYVHDINDGVFGGKFDFIHARCVVGGVKDMAKTCQDYEMQLRPGGVLLAIEGDIIPWDEARQTAVKMAKLDGDDDVSSVSTDGSWLRRMLYESAEAAAIAGSRADDGVAFVERGPWDHELCDSGEMGAGCVYFPIGPWAEGSNDEETQLLRKAGTLMIQNFLSIQRAFHPILRKHGMDQETLNTWSQKAEKEISNMEIKMWIRYSFFWARKLLEGVSLPTHNTDASGSLSHSLGRGTYVSHKETSSTSVVRYPALDIYHTREGAAVMREKLKKRAGTLPQPMVVNKWAQVQAGLK